MLTKYSSETEQKITRYYTKYYRDICCLKDYEKRVRQRLQEEVQELGRMQELQSLLHLNFTGQKHFVFGAGTGGLAIVLNQAFQCQVAGIEPDDEEFSIIQAKCLEAGLNDSPFKKEYGEKLSFPDNEFDFVHCFTVIEHVQDIDRCLDEMIRITKPGGRIYIQTPNYVFPYEPHYKILFPTFLPRFFGRLYLRILGKSPKFLETLNFVTEKSLNRFFIQKESISWLRIYRPKKRQPLNLEGRLCNWLYFKKFVYNHQEIIIVKNVAK